ncbi:DinB family protein [Euzebya tangerina]|uniref:DinB family protein n=1 Tax=Euzebya tangerina TaxID=591198 RepID=UPI000E30DC22|nr:DinB family protein [Euzebya tangerina]
MKRDELPSTGDERTQLTGMLDLQRAIVVSKATGLTRAQLGHRHPPSTLTLAGLLKHLAMVEEWWFRVMFLGEEHQPRWQGIDWESDPDWEFRTAVDHEPAELLAWYRSACEDSNSVIAAASSLDQLSVRDRKTGPVDLRWVILHLIEETARHAGHADLLREAVDGQTGY